MAARLRAPAPAPAPATAALVAAQPSGEAWRPCARPVPQLWRDDRAQPAAACAPAADKPASSQCTLHRPHAGRCQSSPCRLDAGRCHSSPSFHVITCAGAANAPAPAQVVPVPASAPSQPLAEGLSGALDPARARSTINGDAATSQHGPATAAAVGGQSPAPSSVADESPDVHPAASESDAQQNSPPVSDVTTESGTVASPVAGAAVSTSHAPAVAISVVVVVALVAGGAVAAIWRRRRARQYSNLRDTEMALRVRTPHEM